MRKRPNGTPERSRGAIGQGSEGPEPRRTVGPPPRSDSSTLRRGIRCGMKLSRTHPRALKGLANAGPRGGTEALMLAPGFTADMLAGLVPLGLPTAEPGTNKTGGRTIRVGPVPLAAAVR